MATIRSLLLDPKPAHITMAERIPATWSRSLVTRGLGPLRLVSRPAPTPPSTDWIPLRPVLAGICGSDLAALTGGLSRRLLAFASLPAVPGHEVAALDPDGRLVVVDPLLPCTVRGVTPCRACAAGRPSACERFAGGGISPGMYVGFCRDLPGGWSEAMLAHRGQIHVAPEALPPRTAVLAEPLAIAMHGLLQALPEPGEEVCVIGAGTIGLCVVASLRLLGIPNPVTVVARHPHQARMAAELGATRVDTATQARFDLVIQCGSGADSVREGLERAHAGGRMLLLGSAAEGSIDWTEVWARERRVVGSTGYGPEPARGGRHTFDIALEALADAGTLPLAELVTALHPLSDWRAALAAAFDHQRHIKVAFAAQTSG